MRGKTIRAVAFATSLFVLSGTVSCGYILHPERRGNSGGRIDPVTLVLDILWLLPGIIPGVVALVVDFSSGAIYTGGGSAENETVLPEGSRLVINKPKVMKSTKLELRVLTPEGKIVGHVATTVEPGEKSGDKLVLDLQKVRKALRLPQGNEKGVKAEIQLLVNGELQEKTLCIVM